MPKNNIPRLLLAKLRDGDFAHAGDKEAVELVFQFLMDLGERPNSAQIKVLDVGCGFGGTADYLRQITSYDVSGIDIDADAIKYAKFKYPKIHFFKCDVLQVDKIFPKKSFDLIYFFNVFYAVRDQQNCLQTLAKLAKNNALLVIFDYTLLNLSKHHGLTDLVGNEMQPIIPSQLRLWLAEAGWKIIEEVDLSLKFKDWYKNFLVKMETNQKELLEEFSQDAFDKVKNTFSNLLKLLEEKTIGGTVIYAKRANQKPGLFRPISETKTADQSELTDKKKTFIHSKL